MMLEQTQMLVQIMALEFTAVDFNLYLDTHPDDQRALMDYNSVVQELAVLKDQYQRRFGPLTNFGYASSQYPWAWVTEPWPWEVAF
ncbi:spore coat protein CotJB [Gelria sp. Kuro-4]|jgi:spore coat protein JB|uniref:spore coat protein CotJB n=1 Tax=Gelria sp. Kuro-4 TaxID=2796927 RepID=UPI001BEF5CD0|nr:spore coat protein CotJB [Gelria sp. Kuro-4]MDK2926845.1 spore coat protein [Bacillota bacterium]BCV23899.1 spore coat protein CotJB [Gelria sp. Kuro-4]